MHMLLLESDLLSSVYSRIFVRENRGSVVPSAEKAPSPAPVCAGSAAVDLFSLNSTAVARYGGQMAHPDTIRAPAHFVSLMAAVQRRMAPERFRAGLPGSLYLKCTAQYIRRILFRRGLADYQRQLA